MKALIEKKVVREPYTPSEDLNGKMVSETATIYFLRLPIFKRTTTVSYTHLVIHFSVNTSPALLSCRMASGFQKGRSPFCSLGLF